MSEATANPAATSPRTEGWRPRLFRRRGPAGDPAPPQASNSAPRTEERPEEPSIGPADVPERPALAEGVELAGQMEDSAFEEQPWLILREGAFIQVTALLYKLAGACDGKRGHDEIAAKVSKEIGRTATADNVRKLLERKLIPMGVIPKADGTVVPSATGPDGRSPLRISLKTRQVPTRVVDPLARAFKFLFLPPVALGIVAVAATVVGWLLVFHGVGGSFRGAIYEPWLIVVLLPIIVASAAFHEFGHAAALAYGGGKVRGMGAGMYFVYPVFFTDVTDNYRLKRSSKVRTDLGGFYFNLIFVLGLTAVYFATGLEFLLLGVVAIVFGIVHQLMPIMRLDGYWTLADLTGIPDPFSALGPFVKSLIPGQRDDRRLARPAGGSGSARPRRRRHVGRGRSRPRHCGPRADGTRDGDLRIPDGKECPRPAVDLGWRQLGAPHGGPHGDPSRVRGGCAPVDPAVAGRRDAGGAAPRFPADRRG
jgi:putative peptide zinc metalloprotease protein